ncbi:MAG: S1C family serine protease [Planctomycetota bacterium]
MENKIECPICESNFVVGNVKVDSVLRCPSCARTFRYSQVEQLTLAAQAKKKSKRSKKKRPSAKANQKLAKPDKPKLNTPSPVGIAQDAEPDRLKSAQSPGNNEPSRKKKPTPQRTPMPVPGIDGRTPFASAQTLIDPPSDQNGSPALPATDDPGSIHHSDDQDATIPVAKPIQENEGPIETADLPTKSASLVSVRQRYQRKNRNRTYQTLAFAGVFAVLIAGLTTWFVIRLNNIEVFGANQTAEVPSLLAIDDNGSYDAVDPGDAMLDDATPRSSNNSSSTQNVRRKPKPKPIPRIEFAKLPELRLELLNQENLESAWAVAQPRLVALKVHRLRTTSDVVGLIVDSRGWVLTSYSGIAGATRIEITECAKLIDDTYDGDQLRDEVRGIIATDQAQDLALVSINRRFVKSLGTLNYGQKSDVVTGQYLVHSAPPTPNNPYGRIELEVTKRLSTAELPQAALQLTSAREIDFDNNVWIQTKDHPGIQPGSVLMTANSEMVGFNVFSSEGRAYFMLTDQVADWSASATDNPQPLTILATEEQKVAMQEQQQLAVIASDPIRAASSAVDQYGDACAGFGWVATDDQQFEQMQKFAANMSTILMFTLQYKNSDDESETVAKLKKQADKWRKSISEAIGNPDNKQMARIESMIKLSAEKLKQQQLSGDDQYIPFFGKVYVAGIVSPDPNSMFLSVGRDEAYVRAPYQDTGRVLLPDSEWLFFIKRDNDRQTTNHRYSGMSFSAESAQLMFSIGPLPSSF